MSEKGFFWQMKDGTLPLAPIALLLGWRLLEVDTASRTLRASFQAKDAFLNPAGTVQGGILCAMLDETMGHALASLLEPGEFAPTLELKTNFVRPARPGEIVAEAKVLHLGKRIAHLEARLLEPGGELIAFAVATAWLGGKRSA